ncbi:hypothetical protein [Klebsiella pneumoniae]|uniref:Uncharacterized protein n=1 Tax=Escherichia coli TaxID=562 RepID=A0A1Z1VVA4_ECOLX|nr:hypothetical protein [Escherichia coli]EPS04733.1 hypothetical protein KKPNMP14_55520 [Klebsiella pneumoniae subsp. pneumoniae MP14]EPS10472.1 hypothetical protein UKKV901664_23150 [Klebsiella pneumoniae subsp. pneumoniae UKKV901664]CDL57671.1 hypothetical protein [Klebsiella pneumoniae]
MFGRFSFKAMKISPCTVCINCKYHSIFMVYLQCKDFDEYC